MSANDVFAQKPYLTPELSFNEGFVGSRAVIFCSSNVERIKMASVKALNKIHALRQIWCSFIMF